MCLYRHNYVPTETNYFDGTFCFHFVFFIGHLTLYAFLTPFLQSTLHVSGNALSFLYLLFGIAAICGSWFGGYASDRFGNRQTMVVALSFFLPLSCLSYRLFQTAGYYLFHF